MNVEDIDLILNYLSQYTAEHLDSVVQMLDQVDISKYKVYKYIEDNNIWEKLEARSNEIGYFNPIITKHYLMVEFKNEWILARDVIRHKHGLPNDVDIESMKLRQWIFDIGFSHMSRNTKFNILNSVEQDELIIKLKESFLY